MDLLRAVAISWVLIFHASLFNLVSQDTWIVRFGWMGVDLFFVLSGFLIAGQLLRQRARGEAPSYRRFFARRALRTLPAYLAVVALYFFFPGIRERQQLQPLWQFLTFTQNFNIAFQLPKAFSQAWSLCVEEQFYLAFPVVAAIFAVRPSAGRVIGAMLAVLFFGMMLRGYLWVRDVGRDPLDPASHIDDFRYMTLIYYPTWSRLDGLLAGVAAASIQAFRPGWWRRLTARPNALLAAGVTGVGIAMFLFRRLFAAFVPTVFGFPLLAFSMAMVVIAGSTKRSLIGRHRIPGAGALAAAAYSLYLSNKIVFHAVQVAAAKEAQIAKIGLLAGLSAALAGGTVLYWLVERPCLKLRDRMRSVSPSPTGPQPSLE